MDRLEGLLGVLSERVGTVREAKCPEHPPFGGRRILRTIENLLRVVKDGDRAVVETGAGIRPTDLRGVYQPLDAFLGGGTRRKG